MNRWHVTPTRFDALTADDTVHSSSLEPSDVETCLNQSTVYIKRNLYTGRQCKVKMVHELVLGIPVHVKVTDRPYQTYEVIQ